MTSVKSQGQLPDGTQEEESNSSFTRWMMIGAGGLAALTIIVIIAGLVLALAADSAYWSPRISIIRDIFIIIVALEFVLIIAALTILILQVARLVNLLQSEVKPIIDNTRETTQTAKETAQFVGTNITQPLIRISAFLSGLMAFLREWGGIRRAIRPSKNGKSRLESSEGEK